MVLTEQEVDALLNQIQGQWWILCSLLYGSGLRLMEGIRLRVNDIEFTRGEIVVREQPKGHRELKFLSSQCPLVL